MNKNANSNLEEKIKLQDIEINHMKNFCEELKHEISLLKNPQVYFKNFIFVKIKNLYKFPKIVSKFEFKFELE